MERFENMKRRGEERRGEERRGEERRRENLWLPATVDLSYCTNRFKLGSRSDPAWRNLIAYSDWLLLTDRWVVIGCLLIDSRDTYRNMIVRFVIAHNQRFSLAASFSLLSRLFTAKENFWDQGKQKHKGHQIVKHESSVNLQVKTKFEVLLKILNKSRKVGKI